MIDTDTLHLQWALSYPFPRPQTPFIFLDGAYDVRLRRGGEPAHGAAPARPHTAPLASECR